MNIDTDRVIRIFLNGLRTAHLLMSSLLVDIYPCILLTHFVNSPFTGDNSFASNDIGWIEDGTFAHVTSMSSL